METKGLADAIGEGIKIIGGILGAIAFFWKLWESFLSYLQVDLEINQNEGEPVTAIATVSNKGILVKKIQYAFLLIGPETESSIITAQTIATFLELNKDSIKYVSDIYKLCERIPDNSAKYVAQEYGIIPLPFFYIEQTNIGDETLKYRCTIDSEKFKDGIYSVRFFITNPGRLHRSTQDLLVKEEKAVNTSV